MSKFGRVVVLLIVAGGMAIAIIQLSTGIQQVVTERPNASTATWSVLTALVTMCLLGANAFFFLRKVYLLLIPAGDD